MDRGQRSPLRLLAPMALVAFAIAFLFVLGSSDVNDDGSGSSSNAASTSEAEQTREREPTTTAEEQTDGEGSGRRTYTVQAGDTLAGIAEKTGVTVEQLQELNPELDPQALVSGQKIKLRE